jgi:hypothetical protein
MDKRAVSSWLSGLTGAHVLQFDRELERADFLATLLRSSSANSWWAIPADGGLLTDFGLLENILMPAQVKGDSRAGARLRRWMERLKTCGIAPIPLTLPLAALSPWQARVTAFLRAVVADAPALIFDDTCYGLNRDECRQAVQLHGFFRHYFPFRPTVYITLSAPPQELNILSGNCHHHDTVCA